MRIAVIYCLFERLRSLFEQNGYHVVESLDNLSYEELEDVEVIIGNPNKERLKKCNGLRYIQLQTVGMNGYDNPELYCNANQVILANARGVFDVPMAEYAVGAMILLGKSALTEFVSAWPNCLCRSLKVTRNQDREIAQSTVFIFGCGSIGKKIATLLKGIGCKRVVGISRTGNVCPEFDEILLLDESDSCIKEADYIISVMPENAESMGYWTEARFRLMNTKVIFLNIGRGSAVRLSTVRKALKKHWISGAVLDVTEKEPLPIWSRYRFTRRLLITDHLSWYSNNNDARLGKLLEEQVGRYLNGDIVLNDVKL